MDRTTNPPFMLQLFYRTGAFHRPDEFATDPLPPHLNLHTWSDCTLDELTHHIAGASPDVLPNPAIGVRLAFRLIFPDTRGNAPGATAPRYLIKELGSVVIGDGGPGLDPTDVDAPKDLESDGAKTLSEARFVVGDYISCAILPPLGDGSVAPASAARMGRGAGAGEVRNPLGRAPGAPRRELERDSGGFGPPRQARGGRLGRDVGYGGRRGDGLPMGEWRRGERLPDTPNDGWSRRGHR
ncbi:Sin3 associated polypeptide p18-domain-containing protein [Xylariaceae sp. FL0016]|nr:Sin3 associated polypeptide p18-domain-containing protein [Xylariaceae sp. FL0016]